MRVCGVESVGASKRVWGCRTMGTWGVGVMCVGMGVCR